MRTLAKFKACTLITVALVYLCMVAFTGCEFPLTTNTDTASSNPNRFTDDTNTVINALYADLEQNRALYNEAIQAAADLANAHQSLGLAFLEYEMYALALEHFVAAIAIETNNEILHYFAGLAAANHSKALAAGTQKESFHALALHHYQTSINLNANYPEPRYALAVLYLYELAQPVQALETLDALTASQPIQTHHLVLYGYAHASLGNYDQAINYYSQAKQATPSELEQQDLQHNIDSLQSLIDG